MPNRTEKLPNILKRVKDCLENGNYRFTKHALERREERVISLPDILEVLLNGYHEKSKDCWNEQFRTWDYAIRGKTTDHTPCRIVISFDCLGLLIITVIRLNG